MCPIHFTRLKEGYVGHFDGIGSINVFFGYGYYNIYFSLLGIPYNYRKNKYTLEYRHLGSNCCNVRIMCPIHFTRLKEGYVGHFDGIGSINVFFGYGYFCLKHYNNKGKHWCQTTCSVCCNDHCISGIERSCR
jgi:hypothetical protein